MHLTGHGALTPDGHRFVMEDLLGGKRLVSPAEVFEVLEQLKERAEFQPAPAHDGAGDFQGPRCLNGMLVFQPAPAHNGRRETRPPSRDSTPRVGAAGAPAGSGASTSRRARRGPRVGLSAALAAAPPARRRRRRIDHEGCFGTGGFFTAEPVMQAMAMVLGKYVVAAINAVLRPSRR